MGRLCNLEIGPFRRFRDDEEELLRNLQIDMGVNNKHHTRMLHGFPRERLGLKMSCS